ncbi:MAG TPA: hypothetical protein VMJ10_24550 [Kofleriaceae bacterium]|nr:hypothetical protein [Kofleriaceae bacterium]
MDGKALVRLAQLRGRIAALARGGRLELAGDLLRELARADLVLGLPADAILRARQAVQLDEARRAGPLVTLAATLLAAGAHDEAIAAAQAAVACARADERARTEAVTKLVTGAAHRRANRLAEARAALDLARSTAARLGESVLAALALAELAWIELAEDRPAAAATCFEFAAELARRGARDDIACEADLVAVAAWDAADDRDAVADRAPRARDAARAAGRPELAASLDGMLADLALTRGDALAACAQAAAAAAALPDTLAARQLVARARLRQVRAATDPSDRARHLEVGIALAIALPTRRAGDLLSELLVALVDAHADRRELRRVASAISALPDPELAELARAVLAEVA